LDTPKLLLLSGIGPATELAKHNIECTHDIPGVGENLQDHWFIHLNMQLKPGGDDRPSVLNDPEALAAAKEQFLKTGTGPLSVLFSAVNMGWWRPSEKLQQSEEFENLSEEVKKHISYPTVPTWELISHSPPLTPLADPAQSYLTFLILGMVPQSKGSVTLASSDPKDAPICDPNLFSNHFDRQNLFEATRTAWSIMTSQSMAKESVSPLSTPKSMSDEDIWAYAQDNTATTWHMSCTAKMGREDDELAVVDTHFRVKHLVGLRVADMSVTPFLPNCHTMAVAYQIGEMCVERLVEEYDLNTR
jgi:choline dehydrogenase-like flavoprotein